MTTEAEQQAASGEEQAPEGLGPAKVEVVITDESRPVDAIDLGDIGDRSVEVDVRNATEESVEFTVGLVGSIALDGPREPEPPDTTPEVPPLRYLGDTGPELDVLPIDGEPSSFEDVMIQLVDAALEAEEDGTAFGGEQVAQIFCRGDVEDPRVSFLLLLIAQGAPVGADLVLATAAESGHEDLVRQARIAREELAKAGDVSVEQISGFGVSFDAHSPPVPETVPPGPFRHPFGADASGDPAPLPAPVSNSSAGAPS